MNSSLDISFTMRMPRSAWWCSFYVQAKQYALKSFHVGLLDTAFKIYNKNGVIILSFCILDCCWFAKIVGAFQVTKYVP